jgi:hypothetical protein
MARPEIAQLVQSGAQLGMGLLQEKRMGDMFEMEKTKFGLEQEAAEAIGAVSSGEVEFTKRRGAGAQTLAQLRSLAAQDPSVRKTQAPVVFQALEQATGTPLAENLKQFVLSAKPEIAGPVLDQMIRGYARDPNQTLDNLLPVLTSPLTSAQTIGQISRELGDVAAKEAITGPSANPRRDKFLEQRASINRRIQGYQQVISSPKYAQTKVAENAQREVERLTGQLEKMEVIISGQDAVREGVRPGTTLTESGTGNVSVLQGPDDSGGDSSSLGGLKVGDELGMWKMIGPEFGNVIDLDKGIIEFESPAKKALANELTAKATRLFVDAGGKLTRAEAIQAAKRMAVPGGGTVVDASDPYANF